MVNSRLSPFSAALSPLYVVEKLLGHPFFRRYGVILPSSLTEVRSLTSGAFPLPTCVGLRYGQSQISLAAFLGGLGVGDFRPLARARSRRQTDELRIFQEFVLRTGSPACPFAGFTFLTASPPHSNDLLWCRTVLPAFHRLRLLRPRLRSRLTLGRLTLPRNPQAFGVDGSHIDDATHSGIRSSLRSTSAFTLASPPRERSPTIGLAPNPQRR